MARLFFLLPALVSLLAACTGPDSELAPDPRLDRPNIVLILADDVGVMDVCSYARSLSTGPDEECFYETPNIDQLAASGALFRRAYAAPLCSPSRASLITGVYGPKLGFNNAFGLRNYKGSYFRQSLEPEDGYRVHDSARKESVAPFYPLIPASSSSALSPEDARPSLPTYLHEHTSAFIGKWHLGAGGVAGYQPRDHGFQEIAYLDEGFSSYFDWEDSWHKPGASQGGYLTEDITRQAANWIRDRSDPAEPFFLMVSHFATHGPYQARAADVSDFSGKTSRGNRGHANPVYAAMLRSLDDSVGEMVSVLRERDQLENTLIVFASDNGAIELSKDGAPVTSNLPFKGEKASAYEGGIRIPLLLSWPARIEGPVVVDHTVDITDLYATVVEAGAYDMRPYQQYGDGQSLLQLAAPEPGAAPYRKAHFFYDPFYRRGWDAERPLKYTPKTVVIDGDYKLIFYHHGYFELFDLLRDPYEKTDLAGSRPELVRELYSKIKAWESEIPERYRTRLNPAYNPAKPSKFPPYVADPLSAP